MDVNATLNGYKMWPVLACLCGANTVHAQTLDELRQRSEVLDHVAKTALSLEFCKEPPRRLNLTALGAKLSILVSQNVEKELIEISRERRIRDQVPPTATRACLFIEENYGSAGKEVPGLVVIDDAEVEKQRRAAEYQATRARADEARRRIESERLQAEEAARWRERLSATERACVDQLESQGIPLSGFRVLDEQLKQQGAETMFVVRATLLGAGKEDSRRTCYGSFGGGRIRILKTEEGYAELAPEWRTAREMAADRSSFEVSFGYNQKGNLMPWYEGCLRTAVKQPKEVWYITNPSIEYLDPKRTKVKVSMLISDDQSLNVKPRQVVCFGTTKRSELKIDRVQ